MLQATILLKAVAGLLLLVQTSPVPVPQQTVDQIVELSQYAITVSRELVFEELTNQDDDFDFDVEEEDDEDIFNEEEEEEDDDGDDIDLIDPEVDIFLDPHPFVQLGEDANILVALYDELGDNVQDSFVELIVPHDPDQNDSDDFANTLNGGNEFHFSLRYTPEVPEGTEEFPYVETVIIRVDEYDIEEEFSFEIAG